MTGARPVRYGLRPLLQQICSTQNFPTYSNSRQFRELARALIRRQSATRRQSSGATEWPVMAPWRPSRASENWLDDCQVSCAAWASGHGVTN
jgi:hypothetical protein